jgi:small subunit ribosomal protein S20
MPKGKTDTKRFEKQERRRVRNRAVRSAVRTYMSHAREAVAAGEVGEGGGGPVPEVVKRAIQALDRAAKKGVLHPNNAARRKSRLMKRLNAASA